MTQDTLTIKGLKGSGISMVALLANPGTYQDVRVTATGYLHVQFEDNGLYLSKTDADYLISDNALWIEFADSVRMLPLDPAGHKNSPLTLEYFNNKYVRLTGTFDMHGRGHMGVFQGELRQVNAVVERQRWFDSKE
jgi:hypothetical protein